MALLPTPKNHAQMADSTFSAQHRFFRFLHLELCAPEGLLHDRARPPLLTSTTHSQSLK